VRKPGSPTALRRKMVLGDDLGLEEAVSLSLSTLVGRLSYRSRCSTPITEWVRRFWVPLLGYEPEVLFSREVGLALSFLRRRTLQKFWKPLDFL
jgi:hypothetical protein